MEFKYLIPLLGFGVAFISASISTIWIIALQVINVDKTTMRILVDNPEICIVMILSFMFLGIFYNIIKKQNR